MHNAHMDWRDASNAPLRPGSVLGPAPDLVGCLDNQLAKSPIRSTQVSVIFRARPYAAEGVAVPVCVAIGVGQAGVLDWSVYPGEAGGYAVVVEVARHVEFLKRAFSCMVFGVILGVGFSQFGHMSQVHWAVWLVTFGYTLVWLPRGELLP